MHPAFTGGLQRTHANAQADTQAGRYAAPPARHTARTGRPPQ